MKGFNIFQNFFGYLKMNDEDDFDEFEEEFEERQCESKKRIPRGITLKSRSGQNAVERRTTSGQYVWAIEGLLEQKEMTFTQLLLWYIDQSGETDVQVYTRAHIERRHFSKIRKNIEYMPKKNTVLAFAIALRLSLRDTELLLKSAGYSLSGSKDTDIIVKFFIKRRIYDLYLINDYLEEFNAELIRA